MSKAVLFSIKPKYCELIASGKKTIEVRKTKPKLDTPFKCYIYCIKDKGISFWTGKRYAYADDRSHNLFDVCGNGKVIGEFVCDKIITDRTFGHDPVFNVLSCMSDAEIASYCTENEMYGFHISDLVIYDKPKDLGEFKKINRDCWYANLGLAKRDCPECKNVDCFFARPPQSWCYVEELI